jgi:hypothetical protein
MQNNNKKISKNSVSFLTKIFSLILFTSVIIVSYTTVKENSLSQSISLTSSELFSLPSTSSPSLIALINQKSPPTPILFSSWKIYRNKKYGFEIRHPARVKIKEEKTENYDYLAIIPIPEASAEIIIVRKDKISECNPITSEYSTYDPKLNAWFKNSEYDDLHCPPRFFRITCPAHRIGKEKILAYRIFGGDAGHLYDKYYIITNKNYAIILYAASNPLTSEKEISMQEKIFESFRLIDNTKLQIPICDINKIVSASLSLPRLKNPKNDSIIKISEPFIIEFSSPLPNNVGAVINIYDAEDDVDKIGAIIGEILPGESKIEVKLNDNESFVRLINEKNFSGNLELKVNFYRILNKKRIIFREEILKLKI